MLTFALLLTAQAGGWTDFNEHDPGVVAANVHDPGITTLELLTSLYGGGDEVPFIALARALDAHAPEWTHPTIGDPGRAFVVEIIDGYLAGETTPRETTQLLGHDNRFYRMLDGELAEVLPVHAPEWTDPSDGDPGRSLIFCAEAEGFRACDVALARAERREELLLGLVFEQGVWRETYREIVSVD